MTTDLVCIAEDPQVLDQVRDAGQYVVEACERAKTWLTNALEHGDIDQIVEVKSQAEAIRVYTTQKQIGHDAELAAAEVVRRAQRGIGLAIRKGQAGGTIRARGEGGGDPRFVDRGAHEHKDAPTDFVSKNELVKAIYPVTNNVSDEQFDSALAEAKAEQNLSRANVVKHIRATKNEAANTEGGGDGQEWVPDRKDKSRKAVERRRTILRDHAAKGWTSQQIADHLGISVTSLRTIARNEGVEITADKVIGKTRRIDPNRVVDEIVTAVEVSDTEFALIDYDVLDREQLPTWVSSLAESLKRLRRLKTNLERELNRAQD